MSLDFRLRDYFHPWSILRLHRSMEQAQWMAADERDALVEERLRRIVRQAWENIPFYRRLLDQHGLRRGHLERAAQLRDLPMLTKDQLRHQGTALVAQNAQRYAPRWHTTSGTSGSPLRIALDRGSRALEFCYYWRHWSWAGYTLGDRFAELSSLHFLAQPKRRDAVAHWQPHLARLVLNVAHLTARKAAAMAAAIRRRRPRFCKGSPSALHALALALEDARVEAPNFEALFTTGEVLTPAVRQVLEHTFGCPLLDSYGQMEQAVAISQCLHGRYHVHADYGHFELVDLRQAADGKRLGRVLGTSLHNLAMPLLRYAVEDDVEPVEDQEPCACGRTLPMVKAVHGRSEETIITPDGRFLTSLFLLPSLVHQVRSAQIHQESAAQIVMLVVPAAGWSEAEERRLQLLGSQMVGPEMGFRVVLASEDDLLSGPSGKRKVIVSLGSVSLAGATHSPNRH